MSIVGVTEWGGMGALEATIRFAGQRQRLIAHNIANISTPNFIQLDVSTSAFQKQLGEAIDRHRGNAGQGPLDLQPSDEVRPQPNGSFHLVPNTPSGNIAFQDRNNRDLERLMQDQSENVLVFRTAIDLFKSRSDMMRSALAQRI